MDVKGLYSVGALFLARTSPHRAVPSLPMLASCPWSTGSCLSSTGQRPASPSWPARPYLRSPAADSCSPRTTACLWSGPGKASWPNPSSKTPRPCRGSIRRRFHETAEDDEAAGLYSARTPFARPNGVPPREGQAWRLHATRYRRSGARAACHPARQSRRKSLRGRTIARLVRQRPEWSNGFLFN